MNKLGFSSLRVSNQQRSLPQTPKTFQISSRSSSDSITMGSFANLKLTAEKLVKEQASVKTDLEMTNVKLKKSMEHIHVLEDKLKNVVNENTKLKVKQKEDAKMWNGLESKFSSTKALCDQLTETMQLLASQVRDAELDKKVIEGKLCTGSDAFDKLQLEFSGLTVKLELAEENLRKSDQQLLELKTEKDEKEKAYVDECDRITKLIGEKDCMIKDLEGAVAAEKLNLAILSSDMEKVQHELHLKEDVCQQLKLIQENLEKEKAALQSSNNEYARNLLESGQEIKELENSVRSLLEKSVELDKHSLAVSNHVIQMNIAFDTCHKLAQQEKDLILKHAQCQFDQLHDSFLQVTSENGSFKSELEDLKKKISELQKAQELKMVQHAEECRLAEEKIRVLEFEAKTLLSKKVALELQVDHLEENIKQISQTSSLSENKVHDLMAQVSTFELANQEIQNEFKAKLLSKSEEIDVLQKEILRHEELVDSLEKQASQLRDCSEEKEQLHLQLKERVKLLEDQSSEIQASLALSENTLLEAKKQYDLMLESKQMELSKHLKEISHRNDQAINEIRRKFELEKLEILNNEKQKAENLVGEMETKCEQRLAESKEQSKQYLIQVQEQHAYMINNIRQEHDKKVSDLRAEHSEELRHARLEAEDELREKTMLLMKEHEDQIRSMTAQHEDECQKLQEELEIQKAKEEKQRTLLQLQWKVMDENRNGDQEVNSKKDYSVSSIKKRDSDGKNKSQPPLKRPDNDRMVANKVSPFSRVRQTQVSNISKKVENVDIGGVMAAPNHRKVTHRECELETPNGETITKRRKMKRTVMFGDPTKHKRITTPRSRNNKDPVKVTKEVDNSRPSNIGDLFSEGSLNPYADDPYAFD